MGLKGINPIEQHVEKIVVGIFGAACLGVLGWQLLSKPSTVKVGKNDVSMQDAYNKVAEEARRVDAKLKAPSPEGLPAGPEEAIRQLSAFDQKYRGPVAPASTLAAGLDQPFVIGGAGSGVAVGAAQVAEVAFAATSRPTAASFMGSVDPGEITQHPEIAKVLPEKAPFDKAGVSIEATFNGKALREALSADPDGAGPIIAVPRNWWESGTQILGVVLERQTLKGDGTWGESERVQHMPGRLNLIAEPEKMTTAVALKEATRIATEQAGLVRRPPFYATFMGEQWAPPTEREKFEATAGENERTIASLKRQNEEAARRIKALQSSLGNVPGGGGGGGSPPPGRPGGGGGGGLGGGPPGGGGGAPPGGDADERRRRGIQEQIKRLEEQVARRNQQLVDLGEKVEGVSEAASTVPSPKAAVEAPLLDNTATRVWTHDVFAERGKTYRYRVSLALTNPYFGHRASMVEAQADKLGKAALVFTPASDWSDAVTVDPETYLFFTSANGDDSTTGRAASTAAEVYTFAWGRWRRGVTQAEPGDVIAAEIKTPDLAKFIAAQPAATPDAPPPADAPPPGRAPGGRGVAGGGATPAPPPTPGANPTPGIPAGEKIPMITSKFSTNLLMIGVNRVVRDDAGKAQTAEQVVLRDPTGRLFVRLPEADKADQAYARVRASAERDRKSVV